MHRNTPHPVRTDKRPVTRSRTHQWSLAAGLLLGLAVAPVFAQQAAPARVLPGEPTAEQILDGLDRFPASPAVNVQYNDAGFAKERLSKVPAPGIHPRILLSPEDLPDLRRRIAETETGKLLIANLRERTAKTFSNAGSWESQIAEKLVSGDNAAAESLLKKNTPSLSGHYQPSFLYPLMLCAFDNMVRDDADGGKKTAGIIAAYARYLEPKVDALNAAPMSDDFWRSTMKDLMGYHNLGYAYDFAFNFMADADRADVRRVISKATKGKTTMGMILPHHWRNWNWCMVAQDFAIVTLAIEGEEGYDPRIIKRETEVMRDFWSYGFTESGSSNEAVGYTQFGLVWGTPAMIAMARRGDNFFMHSHYQASKLWYLQTMQPWGQEWISHGDGGVAGPAVWTMQAMKYFYPGDPIVDYIWQNAVNADGKDQRKSSIHLIEALVCATDGGKQDPQFGKDLKQPLTWADPIRGSLITRDQWSKEATVLQVECRLDSIGPSHQHADRGTFTLSALGRPWAMESFRSVETRHHNNILIDGKGMATPPGAWLGTFDTPQATFAVCDAKYAYDWKWISVIMPNETRAQFKRWSGYGGRVAADLKDQPNYHPGQSLDPTPSLVAYYKDFLKGDRDADPRMWDEWPWPDRVANNPVQRAFRTAGLVRGAHPYVLIVDDIQKDDKEHLYEWNMLTRMDNDVLDIAGNDITMGAAGAGNTPNRKPKKGDALLLVRVLESAVPAKNVDYDSKPSFRLETFEKKDTDGPAGRSFGLDKRLVIASRAVAPNFKILMVPHRAGEETPVTSWNEDHTKVTLKWGDQQDECVFSKGDDGRTRVTITRDGKSITQTK